MFSLSYSMQAAFVAAQYINRYIVHPVSQVAGKVKKIAMTFIPSYIEEVIVVNTKNPTFDSRVKILYQAHKFYYTWHRAHHLTTYMDTDAFYVIRAWNGTTARNESYFLNAQHLTNALGVKHLGYMWALSDFGIISQVASYITSLRNTSKNIYEIQRGNTFVLDKVQDLTRSLQVPKNITVDALCCLLDSLPVPPSDPEKPAPDDGDTSTPQSQDPDDEAKGKGDSDDSQDAVSAVSFISQTVVGEDNTLKIIDYTLDEVTVKGSDFIVS